MLLVFVHASSQADHSLLNDYHSKGRNRKITLQRAPKSDINQLQNQPKHIRFDVIEISISKKGNEEPSTTLMYHFLINKIRQNNELS